MHTIPVYFKQSMISLSLWTLASGLLSASGLLGLGASSEVEPAQGSRGVPVPASAPATVWVTPFATDQAEVHTDPGGPLKRRQTRKAIADQDDSQPETLRKTLRESVEGLLENVRGSDDSEITIASKSATLLQRDLVRALNKAGIPAQAWTDGANWPSSGVMIDGQFLTIDEGNQLRRTVIGLGAGKSYLDVQVQVYDLTDPAALPFMVFSSNGDSGIAPGLLVGGAVGKAVTSTAAVGAGVSGLRAVQKGTPDDLENTAASVSDYLSQYWQQQGWLPATEETTQKQGSSDLPCGHRSTLHFAAPIQRYTTDNSNPKDHSESGWLGYCAIVSVVVRKPFDQDVIGIA